MIVPTEAYTAYFMTGGSLFTLVPDDLYPMVSTILVNDHCTMLMRMDEETYKNACTSCNQAFRSVAAPGSMPLAWSWKQVDGGNGPGLTRDTEAIPS